MVGEVAPLNFTSMKSSLILLSASERKRELNAISSSFPSNTQFTVSRILPISEVELISITLPEMESLR